LCTKYQSDWRAHPHATSAHAPTPCFVPEVSKCMAFPHSRADAVLRARSIKVIGVPALTRRRRASCPKYQSDWRARTHAPTPYFVPEVSKCMAFPHSRADAVLRARSIKVCGVPTHARAPYFVHEVSKCMACPHSRADAVLRARSIKLRGVPTHATGRTLCTKYQRDAREGAVPCARSIKVSVLTAASSRCRTLCTKYQREAWSLRRLLRVCMLSRKPNGWSESTCAQ